MSREPVEKSYENVIRVNVIETKIAKYIAKASVFVYICCFIAFEDKRMVKVFVSKTR